MKKIAFLILTLTLYFPAHVSAATNYYVSPTGSDTNAGTAAAPFKTISKGMTVAQPGDTVYLGPGTYPSVVISKSGTASAPITIRGNQAIISGGTVVLSVTGSYLIISGIEVTNAVSHGLHITGKHITLSDFSVHDNVTENKKTDGSCGNIVGGGWGSGLSIKYGSDDIQVTNGLLYHNCGEGMAATRALNVRVSGMTSYDNFSANLYIDNSINVTLSDSFAYCTPNSNFYRDGQLGTGILIGEEYYSGWGAQLENIQILNNISFKCKGINFYGAEVSPGGLVGALIANNTIWDVYNGGRAINISAQPNNSNIVIRNNVAAGAISTGTGITVSNNQTTAIFQTTPTYNINSFCLAPNSPGFGVNGYQCGTTTPPTIKQIILDYLKNSPASDLNHDGKVNIIDAFWL